MNQTAERRGACLGDDLTAITLVASLIGTAFVERILERMAANLRHPREAPGGSFHFQGCGTATTHISAQVGSDPKRSFVSLILFAGLTGRGASEAVSLDGQQRSVQGQLDALILDASNAWAA